MPENTVDTTMKTKKNASAAYSNCFFPGLSVFLKHTKCNSGGITSEIAVNRNPPSVVKSLLSSFSFSFQKDIQRDNVSEPRKQICDRRNHHRLQDSQSQPLRIRHKNPQRSRIANRRFQHFIQRRRVDRIREQTAQEHHDVHDHRRNGLRRNHQQNVLLDSALHAAVREQSEHRTQHHEERGDPDRPSGATRSFRLGDWRELLLEERRTREAT